MATEVTVIVDPDNGAGTDYTSLAAAIAGEARNLVTADEQLTIKCRCTGGTADGPATVSGFTTDATRYVKIWTDPSESYRHAGIFPSGNKYRIVLPSATYVAGIRLTGIQYSQIIGISIQLNHSFSYAQKGIACESAPSVSVCRVDKCVIAGGSFSTASSRSDALYCSTGNNMSFLVSNCVVYGLYTATFAHNGFYFYSTGSSRVYNCTVYGCSGYGVRLYASGTVHVKNSAVFGCGLTDISKNGGTLTVDYCASDDGIGTNAVDISPGATEADDWAACFTDYANGDFSLKSDSVCVGAGTDDPGSGLYSDDILGNARTSPWDIGAFEYVSAAPSGITGTLAATLADSTSSSAGAVAIAGASAQTLANSTTSSAGAVAITGASAPTLASATLSSAGAVVSGITGSFAQTLADSTLSGTGTVAIAAALAQALADAAVSSSGSVLASGALGAILADSTVAATGTVAVSGSLASTLADATVSASSSASAIGALSATLSDASLGASGAVAVSGSASATLADSTASSAGRVAVSGSMSATLADATLSAYFGDSTPAQLSTTLASATVAATGEIAIMGALSAALQDAFASGAGTVDIDAECAATLADCFGVIAGRVAIVGCGSATLAGATLSAHAGANLVPDAHPSRIVRVARENRISRVPRENRIVRA